MKGWITKGGRKCYLGSGDDFAIVYVYVKTYQTVHFKYLRIIVCQLCLSKVVLKGWRETGSDVMDARPPVH